MGRGAPEQDRRKHGRRRVRYIPLRTPAAGNVLDISPSGMTVETSSALGVGKRNTFSIGEEGQCARVRGEVRWCRLITNRDTMEGDFAPVFRAGIRFLGIADLP